MTQNLDTAKGRIKQAIADLTGNKQLHREGKRDELAGKAKAAIDNAKDATNAALADKKSTP